ncbi:hypothetical protein [Marinomonas sp. THO17]|uniref:hypothetical protein n=1 Tax=Marinomonas sp. THO17 TaxID=3149048 RepID=UPI00336C15ED
MTSENITPLDSKASLSAMFDGEATTQDIEALLAQDTDVLAQQAEAIHAIQQVLHKETQSGLGLEMSLLSRIHDGIADQESDESVVDNDNTIVTSISTQQAPLSAKTTKPHWKVWFSSMAVAASVAFFVVLGGNLLLQGDAIPNGGLTAEVISTPSPDVKSLAEVNQQALPMDNAKLQQYLRQHAEQATMTVGQGMIPMARVVNYPVRE